MIQKPRTLQTRITQKPRTNLGLPYKTIPTNDCNNYDVCSFTITTTTDYELTDNNISVEIYLDDNFWKNYTIQVKNIGTNISYTEMVTSEDLDDITPSIRRPILWLTAIIIGGLLSLLWKKNDWGASLFKISIVIITLVEPVFAWVLLMFVIGLLLRHGIKRIIGE